MNMNSGDKEYFSNRPSLEWAGDESRPVEAAVPVESAIDLVVNNNHLATLHCSPDHLGELSRGYLLGQGLVASVADILSLRCLPRENRVEVELKREFAPVAGETLRPVLYSGCGQGLTLESAAVDGPDWPDMVSWEAQDLLKALRRVLDAGEAYRKTRGMHSAGLHSWHGKLLCHREDVGRHNALDKVLGWSALQCLEPGRICVALSGRVSVDAVMKVVRFGIPVVVSKGVPTTLALDSAAELGLTLASSIGRKRLRVYTSPERVGL